jgi:hypothetical protein
MLGIEHESTSTGTGDFKAMPEEPWQRPVMGLSLLPRFRENTVRQIMIECNTE